MNIGVLSQKKEKYIDGINRVTVGVLEELLRLDKINEYSFIGNTDWLNIPIGYFPIIPDTRKIIDLTYASKFGRYDIIHSHYRPFDFSEKIECIKILTIHDLLVYKNKFDGPYDYFDKFVKKSARQMDAIITDSNSSKEDIIELFNISEDKIHVIYNGLFKTVYNEENVSDTIKVLKHVPFIFSVSTMRENKNIVRLLEAFDVYKKRNKNSPLKLILSGKSDNSSTCGKRINEILAHNEDIIFTGYVNDSELIYLYKNCLCSAFVSLYEGFGLPVLESLSYGKTVICSDTSSMPEVGGDAVEYCDPYSIESIITAIESIVDNDYHRRELESKTLKQASKFSYEKSACETLKVYNSFKR